MINSLKKQFEGFLKTSPLWCNSDLFDLPQFKFPETIVPDDIEIFEGIPGLSANFVLGKRIESYFAFALQLSDKYRIIAENVQISENKITQGEIDFLVDDLNSGKQLHIEVVYKFYVYDPAFENELDRWIGANRKDTLLQKLKKLKEHQIPLLSFPASRSVLQNLNLSLDSLQQQVCFKAHLFIPKNFNYEGFPYINQNCISGYWISFEEFTSGEYFNFRYFAPKKQDWPVEPEKNEIWYSFDQIKIQIQKLLSENKSPLVWMKKNTVVFERLFVVWW